MWTATIPVAATPCPPAILIHMIQCNKSLERRMVVISMIIRRKEVRNKKKLYPTTPHMRTGGRGELSRVEDRLQFLAILITSVSLSSSLSCLSLSWELAGLISFSTHSFLRRIAYMRREEEMICSLMFGQKKRKKVKICRALPVPLSSDYSNEKWKYRRISFFSLLGLKKRKVEMDVKKRDDEENHHERTKP